MQITHIVPRFPPPMCGLYDYASLLGEAIESRSGIRNAISTFSNDPLDLSSEFVRQSLHHNQLTSKLQWIPLPRNSGESRTRQVIVVHYSGYGYSQNGAPFWLLNFIRNMRASEEKPIVMTMFHELFAPISKSPLSLGRSLIQRFVAAKIARESHCVRTNRKASAVWLSRQTPNRNEVPHLPVFSNLGELAELPAREIPPRKLVLFQPPAYQIPLSPYWNTWRELMTRFPTLETIVAGKTTSLPESPRLCKTGILSQTQAHQLLSTADLGLFEYFNQYLGKSGVFAALAAHAVPVIFPAPNHSEPDGLHNGTHFAAPPLNEDLTNTDSLRKLSRSLFQWYSNHRISATASGYLAQLETTKDAFSA